MGKDTGCAEQLEPVIGNDRKRKAGGKAQGKKGSNPQTGNAASEAPPGAERPPRVNPCLSIPFHPQISPNFGPQFLRRKYGKSPQFLRRNRIWILPVDRHITTNQKDRSCDTVVNSHCTQNRGYTDTLFDCFLVLFNRHCPPGRQETSLGQRNTGVIREQCRKPGRNRLWSEQG